ncbi:hypothetical protein K438DRAFT_1756745 [Mycena galopus ATCC 62051]|nr:hypothetical protein K438DRAFT_1756745 [Mycena galopus ATCC 62051]
MESECTAPKNIETQFNCADAGAAAASSTLASAARVPASSSAPASPIFIPAPAFCFRTGVHPRLGAGCGERAEGGKSRDGSIEGGSEGGRGGMKRKRKKKKEGRKKERNYACPGGRREHGVKVGDWQHNAQKRRLVLSTCRNGTMVPPPQS